MSQGSHGRQQDEPPSDVVDQLAPAAQRLRIDDVSLQDLLDLEPHGVDTFLGIAPVYPMPRIFGGQVVAQGLRAAQLTVEPDFPVHSVHAYFIRAGSSSEPVRFEVERIRNGRSFRTRRVVARQSGGAILNLSASFQRPEEAPDVETVPVPADIVRPDEGEPTSWASSLIDRRVALIEPARYVTWLRLGGHRSEDPALDACGLAFLSDSMPTGAVRAAHPKKLSLAEARRVFSSASLDHVIYFQRPANPHGWLLSDARCHSLVGGRGVVVVDVHTEAGSHALTIVQEVLIRERANKPDPSSDR